MARTARKEREVEHTRQTILRAAARAAAAYGFEALTIRDIAKETGYTVGTLYTYYEGKHAILKGLVGQLINVAMATLDEPTPAGLTFPQKVEMLVHRQLKFADEWRDAISVVMAVIWNTNTLIANPIGLGIRANFYDAFLKWVRSNSKPADLGGREPLEVTLFYLGILQATITSAVLRKSKQPFVNLLPSAMELIFHGLGTT